MNEEYLGDGLYAAWEDGMIRLRAPRGHEDHVIYLDPGVWANLIKFVDKGEKQ